MTELRWVEREEKYQVDQFTWDYETVKVLQYRRQDKVLVGMEILTEEPLYQTFWSDRFDVPVEVEDE